MADNTQGGRGRWGTQWGFILAAIGSAVGLGNVWRFPYMAYDNGGFAFLVPYLVALFVVGLPLLLLEFGLGHHMQASAPLAFRKVSKRFGWIGWWAVTFVMFGIVVYYAVVISWCLSYFVLSFQKLWGDKPAQFFNKDFLQLTEAPVAGNSFAFGNIVIYVLAGLAVVWFINWFITVRQVHKGIEKAARIFIPLLVVVICVLVIWSLTFKGALHGLSHYFNPFTADWSKLTDPGVWVSAVSQIFFTLSVGFGIMIAYASYLPRQANVGRSAIITSLGNCAFSIFAGVAVFATLGFVAQSHNVNIEEMKSANVKRLADTAHGDMLMSVLPDEVGERLKGGMAADKAETALKKAAAVDAIRSRILQVAAVDHKDIRAKRLPDTQKGLVLASFLPNELRKRLTAGVPADAMEPILKDAGVEKGIRREILRIAPVEIKKTRVKKLPDSERGRMLAGFLPDAVKKRFKSGVPAETAALVLQDADVEKQIYEQTLRTVPLNMSGPGLIFKTYPITLNKIPGGAVFAVLFFAALTVAGLSSSISIVEAFSSALTDNFPVSRAQASSGLCLVAFLGGIPFATGGGLYLLDLVDHFLTQYGLMLVGILESVIVGWYFTTRKLRSHIDEAADMRISHRGNVVMRVVLTALLAFTWYGLARAGDMSAIGTKVAMLAILATILLVWLEEHWLDFDIKVIIPGLLILVLNGALLQEVTPGEGGGFYNGYDQYFVIFGPLWLLVTIVIGGILEHFSAWHGLEESRSGEEPSG